MFGFSGLGIATGVARRVGDAVLPEKLAHMVDELDEMGQETEAIREKLMDPVHGPLIPFCTKNYSFNLGRMTFCADVTKDLVSISAGGVGIAGLAETLLSSPDQVFAFLTEAFIPILFELQDEDKTFYKNNIDRVINYLIGLTTDYIYNMDLETFMTYVISPGAVRVLQGEAPSQPHVQYGGTPAEMSYRDLQRLAKSIGVKANGKRSELLHRIKVYELST